MSDQSFTFPPPPPPPPATSQNYPTFAQARGTQNCYGGRSNRGDRGNRGYGRGHRGGGSRNGGQYGQAQVGAGYGAYSGGGNRPPLPPDGGYNFQMSKQGGGGYPLPNYPPVQLPQYPANVGQEYGYGPSNYGLQPVQESFPTNSPHVSQQHGGREQHGLHGYGPQAQFNQPISHAYQNTAAPLPRPSSSNGQPIVMGPPIRWSFDQRQPGIQTQQFSPPAPLNGTSPYQQGPLNSGSSPYYHRHSSSTGSGSTRHGSPNPFPGHRGRGQKREHGDAFGRPRKQDQRPQAAPAVPSFGAPLPLPIKPPAPQERPVKRSKKKRKHNQLGLTPKTEEHESSEEEENDADEEARLAATIPGSLQGYQLLQFEYKGQTSTLKTSSEVSAWIEERRKKFPTKARAEARAAEMAGRKHQREEAHRAVNEARREAQEKLMAEVKTRQEQKRKVEEKQKQSKDDPEDAAAKAKRKVEKLRKQLEKEEKRAAKAEAIAFKKSLGLVAGNHTDEVNGQIDEGRKRKRSASNASESTMIGNARTIESGQPLPMTTSNEGVPTSTRLSQAQVPAIALTNAQDKVQETVSVVPDPLTPMSQPPIPDDRVDSPAIGLDQSHAVPQKSLSGDLIEGKAVFLAGDDDKASEVFITSVSDSSSDVSSTDSENLTSSSGSSSSDASSDDDAPDQASSRRNRPEKVAPPKRLQKTGICRDFLKSGRCRRGDSCHWRHELPKRGSHGAGIKEVVKPKEKKERVGLYQRLVEQEQEKEDHEVLNAIISLGEQGLLEPESNGYSLER